LRGNFFTEEEQMKEKRKDIRAAIVCSKFNEEITSRMFEAAVRECERQHMEVKASCRIPGVFDIPLFVDTFLRRNDVDCAITLGAVIKGETDHDDLIARSTAAAIVDISLKHRKPVALGISGPGATWEQADARAEEYAVRATAAAAEMVRTLKSMPPA
jgi:6,7-dimethyl-8-ribityllumazine synthase